MSLTRSSSSSKFSRNTAQPSMTRKIAPGTSDGIRPAARAARSSAGEDRPYSRNSCSRWSIAVATSEMVRVTRSGSSRVATPATTGSSASGTSPPPP